MFHSQKRVCWEVLDSKREGCHGEFVIERLEEGVWGQWGGGTNEGIKLD